MAGKIKSVGFTWSESVVHMAKLLEGVSTGSSGVLIFSLLLSLRRSLIPLALLFLTAGLRNKLGLEDFRSRCERCCVEEIAVFGSPLAE